ncbi:MAG: Alcohol dehydrogenase 2 [Tenericutes bacterium ADurb.Bin239]|nr:MAG: Alcohol dehydrogenase 2 [Tenericutes bacterium ADurb.Bin239]
MCTLFDRIYQGIFYLARPLLRWREPIKLHSYDELTNVFLAKKKTKVFIVIDEGLAKLKLHIPLLEKLKTKKIKYKVYSNVTANPTIAQVEAALVAYKAFGGEAIIGFGGGSPIDVAKALGARVARPRKSLDKMGGQLKILKKIPLLVAVPTTSGTGSEATLAAVIIDEKTKRKYAINDTPLIPSYALLIPELTVGLPPFLTATTGMDALTHAVEAYTNNGGTKFTNAKAINATQLVFENLKKVYDNPGDLEGRTNMQLAAYDAGLAFTRNYVGYVHALSHPLSAFYGLGHGYVNGLILPFMLEKYRPKVDKKLARLARCSGVVKDGLSDELTASLFISEIRALNKHFGIPETIPEIKKEDIPQLAKFANKEARPLYPTPRLFKTRELEAFYHELKGGK